MDQDLQRKRKAARLVKVRKLFEEQQTVRAIAKATGVSHAQIGYDLRDMGLKRMKRVKRSVAPELVRKVIALRKGGASYQYIKEQTGLSWKNARSVIREHVPELVRNRSAAEKPIPYGNEVLAMTMKGMSRQEQADALGISAIYISKIKERLIKEKKM